MQNEIQNLIDDFKERGHRSNPYALTHRLIDARDPALITLVESVLQQLPKAGTFFADAISFIPESDLPRLTAIAIAQLRKPGQHEPAETFLAHCSLQNVQVLHPFLNDIYELKPNGSAYYFYKPWRNSGAAHFDFLKELIERPPAAEESKALELLLETRHAPALSYCAKLPPTKAPNLAAKFLEVGFELSNGAPRQLYDDTVHHLIFPNTYWTETIPETAPHLIKRHPTWTLADQPRATPQRFGGPGAHTCASCGQPGHHLLTLDDIPAGISITGLRAIQFETCLSCLGWDAPRLYYQHDADGAPSPTAHTAPHLTPQFPAKPFAQTKIHLAQTPPRWQWQDWALSNNRENLNRLGGHPNWVQSAEYLSCPNCNKTMRHLFQLDEINGFLWGSGGLCYAQWCDPCKISAYLWQCT